MSKYSSICDLTESDRQKAISELNESDDLESRISSLRDKIKASDWFNAIFEERLDDQYLKRYLRVAKMDEEIALERIRKMFALQKGTESQYCPKVGQKVPVSGVQNLDGSWKPDYEKLTFHMRMA